MILSNIAQIIGVAGLLTTTPVALPVKCTMNQAPIINITPQTKKIQYDKTRTSAELSQLKSNTISPYGINADQTTGGLRHDRPTMTTTMKFNVLTDPRTQTICMSYNTINVDIKLQPKIYIAKEFNSGRCAREVLEHEKTHVTVDRQVINKYSQKMGTAIQRAVNDAGVIGPFPIARAKEIRQMMSSNIESALASVKLAMANELNTRQQQIDSLEEYERVGKYCERNGRNAQRNRERLKRKAERNNR